MFSIRRFITLIVLYIYVIDGKEYRKDYQFYPEADGWFKLHRIPANWHEARLRCHLEGAVLASPSEPNVFNAMITVMWSHQIQLLGLYSGIHSTFSRGDYFTIEGLPLSKIPVHWAPQEPNNYKDSESCLTFYSNGTMADVKCGDVFPYMCYKKKIDFVINECGTNDNEYIMDTRTGSCYKFHRRGQPWRRAFMTCAAEGGYLSIINSELESQILRDIFARHPDNTIWSRHTGIAAIGFHDWGEHGTWRTLNGQTLAEAGFERFEPNQPDNATDGEFCGSIFRSGLLNDVWCEQNVPFICEKSPDSLVEDQ